MHLNLVDSGGQKDTWMEFKLINKHDLRSVVPGFLPFKYVRQLGRKEFIGIIDKNRKYVFDTKSKCI